MNGNLPRFNTAFGISPTGVELDCAIFIFSGISIFAFKTSRTMTVMLSVPPFELARATSSLAQSLGELKLLIHLESHHREPSM